MTRSGFTKSGFIKGFSACGHWSLCDMGRGTCYYSKSDPETMMYCGAYKLNHKVEVSSLFDEIDAEKIEEIFNSLPLIEESKNEPSTNSRQPKSYDIQKNIQRIIKHEELTVSKITDYEVLQIAAKEWAGLGHESNWINSALEKNDIDKAFNYFKAVVRSSGSGGRMINFSSYREEIKITTRDGRTFNPTVKELFKIYRDQWEIENEVNLFSFQ
ncbi:hypothetical protein [Cytobacillus sp. IB215665]|uniref:hypothetical protein n=1 Tax=Cytobacillus sp. IB215665 TaxID=3097357 RepID=UPI002A0DDDD2|nr:hypothetical protein [Cytobacillus sp. IB215665]MDX8367704.1 hypothetical protein [Cytobacillus sp. IB215665]